MSGEEEVGEVSVQRTDLRLLVNEAFYAIAEFGATDDYEDAVWRLNAALEAAFDEEAHG